MKILAVSVLVTALTGIVNVASASNHTPKGQLPPLNPDTQRIVSTIDDIDIPFDVLNYIQTEYMGHTVTQARRITRSGQQAYQLRVDRDDVANDNESFHLIYDSSWKLISGKEKVQVTTPPPALNQTKPQKQQRQSSDKEERREQETNDSNSDDEEVPIQEEPRDRRDRD